MNEYADDLLVGAEAINKFLNYLGMKDADVYYLKRSGWPIGKTNFGKGGNLIASKRTLIEHTQKLTQSANREEWT